MYTEPLIDEILLCHEYYDQLTKNKDAILFSSPEYFGYTSFEELNPSCRTQDDLVKLQDSLTTLISIFFNRIVEAERMDKQKGLAFN